MEFRLLGPLEVAEHERVLALGPAKQRALLALLLLHANEVVSTERLIDELWPEAAPRTAAKSIQVYVSGLRKELAAGRLVTRKPGYLLRVDPSELDAARFERLLEAARSAAPERAAAQCREALALWRGSPLADLAGEPFAQPEIARLEGLRLAALEQRIDADLAAGVDAELVGELEALAAAHPLRERPRRQLMLALYRSGRQAEALDVYRDARSTLIEQLGIEPSGELRRLEQAILVQDASLDLDTPPPEMSRAGAGLVGRGRELAQLAGALEDALAGRGRVVLVTGEPGIGKSRLAEELIAHATARGARVLVGRCWEAGGAPAYWPWVQSLRAYVRETDAAGLRAQLGPGAGDLAQIFPELRRRFPDLPEPSALEPDTARFRLFDATAEFLRNASASRPMVLVIDDLHAADEPSLLLLRFLAREFGATRIMLLGACRDVDPVPGRPLTEMLAEVAREPVTRRLALGGLSEPELAEYVELTAPRIASPALVAALHEETEGNPLFAGEIVRLLAVEGVPSDAGDAVRIAIPQSVRDVISRRLGHLSGDCARMLGLASVLGREFGLDALGLLGGTPEAELLELLDEAIGARVVSDVPGASGRVRFAHVLIRDTLYEGLTSARRIALHRRVADALEALYGDEPGPHLAELAHHALAGRDLERGLRYARRAGERALALLAYEEAVRLFESALAAVDPSDELTRCELLLAVGDAASRAGDTPGSKRALLAAASLARRNGLTRQLARAAADYGGRIIYARGGDDEHLLPLLEEGLAGLAEEDVELRVSMLARLAGALRDEPSSARREALSREAVELARRSGDLASLAYALDGRAVAIAAADTLAEILAIGAELRELGERIGNKERMVHGHLHRLGPLLTTGRLEEAQADLAAARRIADELRQPAHHWDVLGAEAMLALAAGRLDDAEVLIERARAVGERAQPDMAMPVHRVQRYTLCDFRGKLEQVEQPIRDVTAERPARPIFRCLLALLEARLGRLDRAQRALGELTRDDAAAVPFDQEWLFATSLLAETSGILRDVDAAAVLYELLLPWAELNAVDQCEGTRGSVSRSLGILATTLERWDDADRHFRAAAEMDERMGARPWLARTHDEHARMLLARGGPGDRERAAGLLDVARATYRELGMHSPARGAPGRSTSSGASR